MNIRLLSYTSAGAALAETMAGKLSGLGHDCTCYAPEKYAPKGTVPLATDSSGWAKEGFAEADALVFICAAGIAVRAIAPYVKSKKEDPAVILCDELGRYCVPLLSGHLGGANELALEIARTTGAEPVLTTGTDLHGLFAVDVFAKKNHLYIGSMLLAKEVSAALLRGESVGFESDLPVKGELPEGLTREVGPALGICITADPDKKPFEKTLQLIPMQYAAGLGCRREKSEEELEAFFLQELEKAGVRRQQVRCIASIDVKKDEEAILALSRKYRLPFAVFSAEELERVPGEFTTSEFVKKVTGVDSVCERAAAAASGGRLVVKKQAAGGCTFALAQYDQEEIHFG